MIYYIELGQKGTTLVRNSNGKKVLEHNGVELPISFTNWNDKANLKTAPDLMSLPDDIPIALHLGYSELIALDFDNDFIDRALTINKELKEPCNNVSRSVNKAGGHLIYKHTKNQLTDFIATPNGKKQNSLDTLYGNCILYYANAVNKTKEVISVGELQEMPVAMQQLVISRYNEVVQVSQEKQVDVQRHTTNLAYFIERMEDVNVLRNLLKIITPKRYKIIMDKSQKQLIQYHPDHLPDTESAHMYIVAVSGVLMLDHSVSKEMHKQFIVKLNAMFSEPLDDLRIQSILTRDFRNPAYVYNSNWRNETYTRYNFNKDLIELYAILNAKTIEYIVYNRVKNSIDVLNGNTLLDYAVIQFGEKPKKEDMLKRIKLVNSISRPEKLFGYDYQTGTFNIYKRNEAQEAFYNPELYVETWSRQEQIIDYNEAHPRWPTTTLACLRNAVGTANLRLFLSFMARKYLTHHHSPLIFVFYGVPHSFKSAVVNGVFSKLSAGRYIAIPYKTITEKFNSWMINKDLVLVDEIHYMVEKEQQGLIQTLNSVTGSKTLSGLRKMYSDIGTDTYPQEITFMLCTNAPIKLAEEVKDRRLVIFKSSQKVTDVLGMTDEQIAKAIDNEAVNFAYFLSRQPLLDDKAYIDNAVWKTDAYKDFQLMSQTGNDFELLPVLERADGTEVMNMFINLGFTLQQIRQSIKVTMKNNTYRLILYNANPSVATVPGLYDNIAYEYKKFRKKLLLLDNVKTNVNDLVNGSYNGNKYDGVLLNKMPVILLPNVDQKDITL